MLRRNLSVSKKIKIMNKKNPVARVLQFFTSKRFKDKTKYTRKVKHVQKDKY